MVMKVRLFFLLLYILPFASLAVEGANCFSQLSDPTVISKPNPIVVIDFSEDVKNADVTFNQYPVIDGSIDFENPVDKTGILQLIVRQSNDSVRKYNLTEEVSDGEYYTLEATGYTEEETNEDGEVIAGSIELDDCKLFHVDFAPRSIGKTNPEGQYMSDPAEEMIFETNRKSVCRLATSTDAFDRMMDMAVTGSYLHRDVHPGSSPFYVTCQDESETASETFNVTLDTTPPPVPSIDDSTTVKLKPDISITKNYLRVKFLANDTESGIALINYSIVEAETQTQVSGWMTTSSLGSWVIVSQDSSGSPLKLQDGSQYQFLAQAQNNAGLWSDIASSDGVEINTGYNPNGSNICENGIQDPGEVYLDCAGRCPGCEVGHACEMDTHCASGFCNNETNTCELPACDDGFLNGEEGDIDCGGSCETLCDLGQSCNIDEDCESSLCLGGLCAEASCDDNIKNGDESDIDCGGSCSRRCLVGDSCESNNDCESRNCESGICEERSIAAAPQVDDDSPLVLILVGILALGALGGGGYYAYVNKDALMQMLNNLTSRSGTAQPPQAQQPQQPVQQSQQQAQQPQQPVQQYPQQQSRNVASQLAKDLREKETQRKRSDLFSGFGANASSSGSSAQQASGSSDSSSSSDISKKDIDNLFGGLDSV